MNKENRGGVNPPFFLQCTSVNYVKNNQPILTDFSANISFDRLCLIKGGVGCGKTTFLKIIAGVYPTYSGVLSLTRNNRECSRYFVHANPEFNFVTGNVADELQIAGLDPKEFDEYANRDISELSGGELKKLSILIALKSDREVLLIDEPFEMLDDAEMETVYQLLKSVSGQKGLIVATHENKLDHIAEDVIFL